MTTSNQLEITLSPWNSYTYTINWLQLKEDLSGGIPTGRAVLLFEKSNQALELITELNTGVLTIRDLRPEGFTYTLPIFITSRNYFENTFEIKFVCVEDYTFLTDPRDLVYSNISEALEFLSSQYSKNNSISVDSDIDNNIKIYQYRETNKDLCTRLCRSFKYNTIFGYTWNGILIKDIDVNNISTTIIEGRNGMTVSTTPYQLNYSSQLNYEPNTVLESNNFTAILNKDNYFLCAKGFDNLLKNNIRNSSLVTSGFYAKYSITSREVPRTYVIGDIVKYKSPKEEEIVKDDAEFKTCIVYSNEIFVGTGEDAIGPHGFKFEWTTELLGIDPGSWSY